MNKASVYLCFGRAIICIYLFLVFFMVLAETIVGKNTKDQPSNYEETTQILQYVVNNLKSNPLTEFYITQGNTTTPGKSQILYDWEVKSDWCWCKDSYPFLGACPPESNFTRDDNSSTCKQWPDMSIFIDIWKGSAITASFASSFNWSFPIKSNYTCESSFQNYQKYSGLCTMNNLSLISTIVVTNYSSYNYFDNVNWTWAGHFAGGGESTPPLNDEDEEDDEEDDEDSEEAADDNTSTDNSTTTTDNNTTSSTNTTENTTNTTTNTSTNTSNTTAAEVPSPRNTSLIAPDTQGYNIFYTTNTTESFDDEGEPLESQDQTGSPYLNIKVSRYGVPCLNPYKNPAPSSSSAYYPLTGNDSQGCGYWNNSDKLYEKIDMVQDWNLFLDNDLAKNKSWFDDLYNFEDSSIDEYAFIYAEKKLVVKDTDFCYSWTQNPEVTSDIGNIELLRSMRTIVLTTGFVVTSIGLLSFLIHRITYRCKEVTGGMYLFWLEYGLGTFYAVIALTIGILTRNMISTIDAANAHMYQVAQNACISNVPVINTVYSYLSTQVSGLYGYVNDLNDLNVDTAVVFLLLEAILLVFWLICFQCKEELQNEETLSDKHKGVELAESV